MGDVQADAFSAPAINEEPAPSEESADVSAVQASLHRLAIDITDPILLASSNISASSQATPEDSKIQGVDAKSGLRAEPEGDVAPPEARVDQSLSADPEITEALVSPTVPKPVPEEVEDTQKNTKVGVTTRSKANGKPAAPERLTDQQKKDKKWEERTRKAEAARQRVGAHINYNYFVDWLPEGAGELLQPTRFEKLRDYLELKEHVFNLEGVTLLTLLPGGLERIHALKVRVSELVEMYKNEAGAVHYPDQDKIRSPRVNGHDPWDVLQEVISAVKAKMPKKHLTHVKDTQCLRIQTKDSRGIVGCDGLHKDDKKNFYPEGTAYDVRVVLRLPGCGRAAAADHNDEECGCKQSDLYLQDTTLKVDHTVVIHDVKAYVMDLIAGHSIRYKHGTGKFIGGSIIMDFKLELTKRNKILKPVSTLWKWLHPSEGSGTQGNDGERVG